MLSAGVCRTGDILQYNQISCHQKTDLVNGNEVLIFSPYDNIFYVFSSCSGDDYITNGGAVTTPGYGYTGGEVFTLLS